jgi:ferredoxin
VLHRVIVDARLMQAVRRNLVLWHRLQEQGGIHNSYAERLLAVEKATWEEQKKRELEALHTAAPAAGSEVAPSAPVAGTASEAPQAAAVEEPPAHSPDEAWIDTARCPSCNECQLINDKMFLYNANKQAYIGDLKAGTYKQMVEAAESCQVAIIHPGKPWNDKEPGLAELIERAQPFL